MHEHAVNGSKRYLDVPVGNSKTVTPTMDCTINPVVQYLQGDEPTCVFSSFASGLFNLELFDEAKIVLGMGKLILGDPKTNPTKILETLINKMYTSSDFKELFKKYKLVRLKRSHDLFSHQCCSKDIRLIVLSASDNSQNHAVTIIGQYIFDSNCDRALPFNKQGINCCCGTDSQFVSVAKGYLFSYNCKY